MGENLPLWKKISLAPLITTNRELAAVYNPLADANGDP